MESQIDISLASLCAQNLAEIAMHNSRQIGESTPYSYAFNALASRFPERYTPKPDRGKVDDISIVVSFLGSSTAIAMRPKPYPSQTPRDDLGSFVNIVNHHPSPQLETIEQPLYLPEGQDSAVATEDLIIVADGVGGSSHGDIFRPKRMADAVTSCIKKCYTEKTQEELNESTAASLTSEGLALLQDTLNLHIASTISLHEGPAAPMAMEQPLDQYGSTTLEQTLDQYGSTTLTVAFINRATNCLSILTYGDSQALCAYNNGDALITPCSYAKNKKGVPPEDYHNPPPRQIKLSPHRQTNTCHVEVSPLCPTYPPPSTGYNLSNFEIPIASETRCLSAIIVASDGLWDNVTQNAVKDTLFHYMKSPSVSPIFDQPVDPKI